MSETTVAVVTGAAMGAGRAIAERLLTDGHVVVGIDWNEAALAETDADLGASFVGLRGDVGDWATHELAADVAQQRGRLAVWVNNAGIDIQGGAHEVDPAEIERGLRVLQLGPMYGTALAVRRMLPARAGSIVNVSSIQGLKAFPRYYVYGTAKAAVIALSRSVAVDYGPYGIRCNAVLPGTIETPMLDEVLPDGVPREEALRREGELAPMGRIAQASEIADAVAYLASDASSYVSGTELVVDGGSVARCYAYPRLEL